MADNSIVLGSAAKSAVYTIMIQVMGPEVRGYVSAHRYLRISANFHGYG